MASNAYKYYYNNNKEILEHTLSYVAFNLQPGKQKKIEMTN